MVEQQTLTLYIAVRVRVPQPHFASATLRVAGHADGAVITK